VRAAARHVTQSYDQLLAPTGLRTTQFSILAKTQRGRVQIVRAKITARADTPMQMKTGIRAVMKHPGRQDAEGRKKAAGRRLYVTVLGNVS
jgi:hypothetical protein